MTQKEYDLELQQEALESRELDPSEDYDKPSRGDYEL